MLRWFMLPFPSAAIRSIDDPVALCQWPDAVVVDCTTRQHKTHIADAIDLLYPWHPWVSRPVFVHRTVNKAAEAMFHCSLDSTLAGRLLQIPQWMFDAATMCGIRLSSSPVVDVGSLRELKELLATTNADGVVQDQQLSVDDAGENHAKIITATASGTAEALSSCGKNSGVERTAIGSSTTSTSAARATVVRSSRSRRRRADR